MRCNWLLLCEKASESGNNYLVEEVIGSMGIWLLKHQTWCLALMGLPGVAYWIGVGEAIWTAIGLS